MRVPSRLQIGIAVTLVTIIVCSLGVLAELKVAGQSTGAAAPQAPDAARNNQPMNLAPR